MASTRLSGGKVVRISEYLKDHPNANRRRKKTVKTDERADNCVDPPRFSARLLRDGEVTYGVEDATPSHARPLLLAALSMCIDLVLLRDGLT